MRFFTILLQKCVQKIFCFNSNFIQLFSSGHTHISGAICEKFHEELHDTCSIQRLKDMFGPTLVFYIVIYLFMWYYYEFDIFEFIFGYNFKFSVPDKESHWSFVLLWAVTSSIVENSCQFLRHWFSHFLILACTFCFIDPLLVIRFIIWARATFLPFFQACFTFTLWIFRFFKAVFKKIKKNVQYVFSFFYNWLWWIQNKSSFFLKTNKFFTNCLRNVRVIPICLLKLENYI